MDNFTHTLLGLAIAKAGLERATPLATTTLVISSNLPDIDVLSRLEGGPVSYIEYHRGLTHGFLGLAVLAAGLTLVLMLLDRRFRLRRDPFRRPLRPGKIFLIAYLGGLGHTFMDFTNNYGVRPLLPFSNRWFYGDLVFVADPWIWLILGCGVVWLTTTSAARTFFWIVAGIIVALIVGLALRHPYDSGLVAIPTTVRAIWFACFAVVVAGAVFRWGRAGPRLARYSLVMLALYYGGMWMAHQSARKEAQNSLPASGVTSLSVWPAPANPLLWQAAAKTDSTVLNRDVNLSNRQEQWQESPALDPKLADALLQSSEARTVLSFIRYGAATVQTKSDGTTGIELHDLRFNLRMRVELDADLKVTTTEVHWF